MTTTTCNICKDTECGNPLNIIKAQLRSAAGLPLSINDYDILADSGFDPWTPEPTTEQSAIDPQICVGADTCKKSLADVIPTETTGYFENVLLPNLNKNCTLDEYKEEREGGSYTIQRAKITHHVELSTALYDELADKLMEPIEWLKGKGGCDSTTEGLPDVDFFQLSSDDMEKWRAGSYILALKVTAPGRETIYIDPQGFSYARYVGFSPDSPETLAAIESKKAKDDSDKQKAIAAHERAEIDRAAALHRGKALLLEKRPEWAKAAIIAEQRVNQSDYQSDYHGHSTAKSVIIGWSKHTKDLFPEMRRACLASGMAELADMGPGQDIYTCKAVACNDYINHGRHHYAGELSGHDESATFNTEAEAQSWINKQETPCPLSVDDGKLVNYEWTIKKESIEHREKYSMGGGYYLSRGGRHSGWAVSKVAWWSDDTLALIAGTPGGYMVPEKQKKARRGAQVTAERVGESTCLESAGGFEIEEHTHSKKGFQMFICIMSERVEREEYLSLLERAKELGGWYSRKWGTTPAGFAFKELSAAQEFAGIVKPGEGWNVHQNLDRHGSGNTPFFIGPYATREEAVKEMEHAEEATGKSLCVKPAQDESAPEPAPSNKVYYTMDNVGSAKYTVSTHDGKHTHPDGSAFFGIEIFSNKKDLAACLLRLQRDGYRERGCGEETPAPPAPVVIIEQTNEAGNTFLQATHGKTEAGVFISSDYVNVCCKNASNRVFRRGGRYFDNVAEALAAYKSPAMQAIIGKAAELHAEQEEMPKVDPVTIDDISEVLNNGAPLSPEAVAIIQPEWDKMNAFIDELNANQAQREQQEKADGKHDDEPEPESDRGQQVTSEPVKVDRGEQMTKPEPRPERKKVAALITKLKEAGQDHEFYPTTPEIINMITRHLDKPYSGKSFSPRSCASILDCGAGNGSTLAALTDGKRYAIEKSQILVNEMPADVFVVGCDFHENSLIDKKVDYVFCNPPYSEYKEWTIKIINEANCKQIFLVIPERWKNQPGIQAAIDDRKATFKAIGSADFLEADRKARSKVDVIKIDLQPHSKSYHNNSSPDVDPFTLWVKKEFPTEHRREDIPTGEEFTRRVNELVPARGLVPALVGMYHEEMARLQNNYRAISGLDPAIFAELNIDFKSITEFLGNRIKGLKEKYWRELFSHFEPITSRLTVDSRKKLLTTLTDNVSVDFTESNIYAVTTWAIKNANKYFDTQLIDVFEGLVNRANLVNYKSNKKTWGDDKWRFREELRDGKITNFGLDYRCVITCHNTFGGYSWERGLHQSVHDRLNDIVTTAHNLGFTCPSFEKSDQKEWEPGKANNFNMTAKNPLMSVRAYKNGNVHIKFNQKFLRKLNVEFGRLKGWLRSHTQAADELNIPLVEAKEFFKSNFLLECSGVKLLAAA